MFLIRGAPPAILTSTLKMAPEELDKVLSKFYAEVKKKDGDDNEPETVKMMQSSTEKYLKEKVCPVSIVRSRELHNSQEIKYSTRRRFPCASKGEVNGQTNPNGPKYNRHHSPFTIHGLLSSY